LSPPSRPIRVIAHSLNGALIAAVDAVRRVAALGDDGTLISNTTSRIAGINSNHLKRAHARIERGGARGKIVLEGF
jgi:hypothetical protein